MISSSSQIIKNQQLYVAQLCKKVLNEPEVRFVGLVNKMGNLVEEKFKTKITLLENNANKRKMYIESKLLILMQKEFDFSLSPTKYSACRREKLIEMCFPIDDYVLFVTTNPNVNVDETAEKISRILKNVKQKNLEVVNKTK